MTSVKYIKWQKVLNKCVLLVPGELSAVGCFVHKRIRIVGGGPVNISDGSWMVSIQKGYSSAFNIPHIFYHWRRTRGRPAQTALEFIKNLVELFFLFVFGAFLMLFHRPSHMHANIFTSEFCTALEAWISYIYNPPAASAEKQTSPQL